MGGIGNTESHSRTPLLLTEVEDSSRSSSTISCCSKYYLTGQLPQIRPNPVKILAGAGFGRISKKGPDAGFAGAGAEIRYIPNAEK